MDERFKPIFKVDYSLVRDENGNQDLYCRTSDNVSVISEHYLGNIKDIVGYIEENQQLKQQLQQKEDIINKIKEEIKYLESNCDISNFNAQKLRQIIDNKRSNC